MNVNDKEPLTDSTQQQQKKKSRRRNNRRRNKQNAESSAAGVVPTVEATEDSTKDIAVSSQSEHAVIPKENIKEVIGEVINKDRPKKVEASFLKVLPKLPEDDAETIDKYAKEASKIRQALQDDIGHKFVDDEDKEVIDMIKSSNKSKENWWSKLLK